MRMRSGLVDELFHQPVNLIELKLELRGACELHVELFANQRELIVDQCEHFGRAHFRACRSRRTCRTSFTLPPLLSPSTAFALHRLLLCHLAPMLTNRPVVKG